ncbi:MAG: hypothetical protein AAF514_07705, partial [Verrucomicrobiota bacterium]
MISPPGLLLFFFLSICCQVPLGADDSPASITAASDGITPKQKKTGFGWMVSSDPKKRQRGYAAFRSLEVGGREVYAEMLEKARKTWMAKLERRVRAEEKQLRDFRRAWQQWEDLRRQTLASVRTDHQKDPDKIAELTRLQDSAKRAARRVSNLLKGDKLKTS